MNEKEIQRILSEVKDGRLSPEGALASIKETFYKDLGHTTLDTMRESRVGYPEVIYCAGKTHDQVLDIIAYMNTRGGTILATRADRDLALKILSLYPEAEWNELGRTIVMRKRRPKSSSTYIAIVTAGTSDLAVAEEAKATAEAFGNEVRLVNDVGVAGIHRLMDRLDIIRGARVVIVIAGMEGALASVVAGQIDKPVIAVPTSVGYGANFSGLSALLAMLTSCAAGIGVVNIDNGFGAGYLASMINSL